VAGQRIDPSTDSPFVWRVTSTDTYSDTLSIMKYTNWDKKQPNYGIEDYEEACTSISTTKACKWHDFECRDKFCAVCEIDMA